MPAARLDPELLRRDLAAALDGEVRFDEVSRALYSTDASVYQIEPLGVVLPRSQADLVQIIEIGRKHGTSLTMRGGGTSQAGQAIGAGVVVDTSKYLNRVVEVNAAQRWARVEPGVVLDDLNTALRPHGLRFAPDISTANRATVGGMIANNSSGARSVLYGKTIDHVLELHAAFADGKTMGLRPFAGAELEGLCGGPSIAARGHCTMRALARTHEAAIEARFPKVLRRVGGYNLDAFVGDGPVDLTKLLVGSEGTLAAVLEAKVNLVPLPAAKAVLAIQFDSLLEALDATPSILAHRPSAVEVMDGFILSYTKASPALERLRRTFIEGDPGALLCVEFYGDRDDEVAARLGVLERDLKALGFGARFHRATEAAAQTAIWRLREAALGLSMAMKGDAKSLSFVEDTAVAPERLRDYMAKFLAMVARHGTKAGVYAHASVGCLHVRPIVNLKTEAGVRQFEAIARDSAALALEFGGALSGEHGDGLVRGPFMEQMFGSELYQAFRTVKRTFDPDRLFNPGKIVDSPPLTSQLRYGPAYVTATPVTFFDYAAHGGFAGAVEMCSGLGACRKTAEGTMCPSYMATREEQHTTRGRANVLRLAIAGRLGETGLDQDGVHEVLDLCLECRACKSECPVSVDMARFKSEALAQRWRTRRMPLSVRAFAHVADAAPWGSRLAPLSNQLARSRAGRWLGERLLDVDRRRVSPAWARRTLISQFKNQRSTEVPSALLFNDTFTNHFAPAIGLAAAKVLRQSGVEVALAPNVCCGRPLISQGLLDAARRQAERNTDRLLATSGPLVFLEPSCLSALKEDAPSLLRGERQAQADRIASRAVLFESFLGERWSASGEPPRLANGPSRIVWHAHCHQKAMGQAAAGRDLLSRVPRSTVIDLDAGCCGMAGSFGYSRDHFEVSRAIGERRLLPAARALGDDGVLVASGTSCRQQVVDFTGVHALHPAELLAGLLVDAPHQSTDSPGLR